MSLDERLKQRLLGGAVLVALMVIFVPMLIEEPIDQQIVSDHTLPVKPQSFQAEPSQPEPVRENHHPERSPTAAPAQETNASVPVTQTAPPVELHPAEPQAPDTTPQADAPVRPSPSAWMIQVASLTREDNARKLVEDLRKADLPAQMETARIDGKTHYRVRVGPEVDHRLAEQMVEKIHKQFKLKPKLMRYP